MSETIYPSTEVDCTLPETVEGQATCPDCGRVYEARPDPEHEDHSNWVEVQPSA